MIVADIYAFHADIGDARLNETVGLWESIWRKHGWTPHILGLSDAAKHPDFNKMWAYAERVPTVNDRLFSTVNFVRWCAFSQVNGAITDYDVLPRTKFPPRDFKTFFNGDRDGGPGFIVGQCSDFERIIKILINHVPCNEDQYQGRPHVSDMGIQRHHSELYQGREDLVRCYGVDGWRTVPLVHFGNGYLDSSKSKRQQMIEILRKEGAICE